MPLTITQQMDIIEKRVAPPNLNVDLKDIVSQTASSQAKTFVDGVKMVDPTASPLAQEYKDKILKVCFNAFNRSGSIGTALVATLITIGAPNTDLSTVQALDQAGWENFVASNMFAAFEYVAGTTVEEKQEYDNLP